jgi:Outer membrane protein beta-barrel domain
LKPLHSTVAFLAGICFTALGHAADGQPAADASLMNDATWRARLGLGVNPVVSSSEYLPKAHTGFGASLAGFVQLPYRLNVGLGADWERYTFDSNNNGDANRTTPRYTDEVLTHVRVMAQLQWDILKRQLITPSVFVGAGYGWEGAELTTWQCQPRRMHGPVVGAGVGLDLALNSMFDIGLEYRANTLPLGTRMCTLALIEDEPLGTPSDFFSQRIGLTFSVRR